MLRTYRIATRCICSTNYVKNCKYAFNFPFHFQKNHSFYTRGSLLYQRSLAAGYSKKFVTYHFDRLSDRNFLPDGRKSILFEKNNDELMSHGKEILQELCSRNDLTAKMDERFKNELSGILYQYFIRDNKRFLLEMFEIIWKKNKCNEACYTILMRYFADNKDLEKVKYYFAKLEQDPNTQIQGRSFVPMILVCLRCQAYDQARLYFNRLVDFSQKEFKENAFQDILVECSHLVTEENGKYINSIVDRIFNLFQQFGSGCLNSKTINAIKDWFQRDPCHRWKIMDSDIGEGGTCRVCKEKLKPAVASKERLRRLERNMMILIESSIARKINSRITDVKLLKTNINIKNKIENQSKYYELFDIVSMETRGHSKEGDDDRLPVVNPEHAEIAHKLSPWVFAKLRDLREYIDSHGPFDVVIDVLNTGYFTKGFNPLQVRDVVSSFQGKKVLILCAGILKKEILEQDPVAPANRRIQQLLRYMDKNFKLFFAGSSILDDYYILYTILLHHFNIELVSRDLFRDHLFHLDSENTSDFQRWQKSNQYILKSFTSDNKPIFMGRTSCRIAMQKSDNDPSCWHVPVSDTKWLCIHKEHQ